MWMLTRADYCADEVGRPFRALTRIGELATHPAACLVAVYAGAWLAFSPGTFGWGAVATLAAWMTTLFITRTERRDT